MSAGRFITAVLVTFITTAVALGQTQTDETTRPRTVRPQSTNQIVGAQEQKPQEPKPDVKPVEVKPAVATQDAQPNKTVQPKEEAFDNIVVPPSPLVVTRNTNTISVPIKVEAITAPAKAETKYEERPVISSKVSVGSVFGYRRDPFTRRAKFHSGVDIKAHWGDPVGASQPGVVQFAGWYHGYGNLIIIAHGGGVTTHYAHLSSFDVEPGMKVERGTIIGRAGSTGRATSPHLHYEVRLDGNPLNPFQPLALDPSSEYFKLARPTVDAGRADSTLPAASQQREK